ncbi:hypothetical protein FNF29_07184 [Cafeteria roenbergensis]|uniref:Uncharacterized protein n=1 Tax=Cafeteria roenbergensis TaxID=33653 RepID=A0A5A8C6M5_CAFRO|nr:hypothetical protein FNF29_07184 [Cafeteria roenbergensis]|eukprot:KAA0147730.1 hypothetical protein FNF29_07184 [Cafeteria roenbergensis]
MYCLDAKVDAFRFVKIADKALKVFDATLLDKAFKHADELVPDLVANSAVSSPRVDKDAAESKALEEATGKDTASQDFPNDGLPLQHIANKRLRGVDGHADGSIHSGVTRNAGPDLDHGDEQDGGEPDHDHADEQDGGEPDLDHGDEQDGGEPDLDHGDEQDGGEPDHDHADEQDGGEPDHDHGDEQDGGEPDHDHGDEQDGGEPDHDHGDEQDGGEPDHDHGDEQDGGKPGHGHDRMLKSAHGGDSK